MFYNFLNVHCVAKLQSLLFVLFGLHYRNILPTKTDELKRYFEIRLLAVNYIFVGEVCFIVMSIKRGYLVWVLVHIV